MQQAPFTGECNVIARTINRTIHVCLVTCGIQHMDVQERITINACFFAQCLHQITTQTDVGICNLDINIAGDERIFNGIAQIHRIRVVRRHVRYTPCQPQNQSFRMLPVKSTRDVDTVTINAFAIGHFLVEHTKFRINPCLFQVAVTIPDKFVKHAVFE